MAKKKKEQEVMPALIAGNYLTQRGNVKVEFVRNGRVIKQFSKHNSATDALCTYIRNALYGDYVIAAKPGKIRICSVSGSTITPISNTPFFPLVSVDRETQENQVNLYFKLPYDSIAGRTISGLKLYAENAGVDSDAYAEVSFVDSPILVTSNTNIRITWSLIVEPKGE